MILAGHDVRFEHSTYPVGKYNGYTLCMVDQYAAVSFCSRGDIFSRKVGRKVALAKALERTPMTKSERTKVWDDYKRQVTYV